MIDALLKGFKVMRVVHTYTSHDLMLGLGSAEPFVFRCQYYIHCYMCHNGYKTTSFLLYNFDSFPARWTHSVSGCQISERQRWSNEAVNRYLELIMGLLQTEIKLPILIHYSQFLDMA